MLYTLRVEDVKPAAGEPASETLPEMGRKTTEKRAEGDTK